MEWLVRTRVFTSVVVSFLMVGHTHNDADQQFVALTYELRKRVIKSLSDYLAAIKAAYKDPPKAVRHVQAIHDFTAWLKVDFGEQFSGFARRTPDAERPHQFTFELDDSGAVQMIQLQAIQFRCRGLEQEANPIAVGCASRCTKS